MAETYEMELIYNENDFIHDGENGERIIVNAFYPSWKSGNLVPLVMVKHIHYLDDEEPTTAWLVQPHKSKAMIIRAAIEMFDQWVKDYTEEAARKKFVETGKKPNAYS